MQIVYAIGHAVLSPLGSDTMRNVKEALAQHTAIQHYQDAAVQDEPFAAARLSPAQLQMIAARYPHKGLSPFEQMCLYVAGEALTQTGISAQDKDCILILSTTKGNIEWLGQQSDDRISLHRSASLIAETLQLAHKPLVISNACISGSVALIAAKRMLETGRYKHALVIGCDRFSGFVFKGFQSFHALAPGPCRPFDKDRAGINLGEAAAAMVLSVDPALAGTAPLAVLAGGGISNDANHLSGPSRTGEELAAAITAALGEAGITPQAVGAISAHGTATLYNDEMEAKALHHAGVAHAAVHSLKSYIGHTLGAAGIIESVVACVAMQQGMQLASLGYTTTGVSQALQVNTRTRAEDYSVLLKTASGFGGCNAALVWRRAG